MLNPYLIYSFTWGSVLVLYLFGWSGLNQSLNAALLMFFAVTVVFSLVVGIKRLRQFHYEKSEKPKELPWFVVSLIMTAGLFGFIQLGYVPLLNLLLGSYDYSSLLHHDSYICLTIGTVGSVFGLTYQTSRLLDKFDKLELCKLLLFFLYLVLLSSRGALLVSFLVSGLLIGSKAIFKRPALVIVIMTIAVAVSLWLFGVAGNIRSGFQWNDNSYIYSIGLYEGHWPVSLPREFCWAYSYITSPLANLNYSVEQNVAQFDVINYLYDFLPMMIAKRLPFYTAPTTPLLVHYFNVSSIWSGYHLHMGIPGLYLGFVLQMVIVEVWIRVSEGKGFGNLMKAYCSECLIMSFFDNSFVYPTMAYPALMLLTGAFVRGVLNYFEYDFNEKTRLKRLRLFNLVCRKKARHFK